MMKMRMILENRVETFSMEMIAEREDPLEILVSLICSPEYRQAFGWRSALVTHLYFDDQEIWVNDLNQKMDSDGKKV